ncbi:Type 1 glutamine amidotransferase-like domain-containing protein [Marivirga sp. S37H4]|uniref:Type 1 glutamine amidotransferase-like domain-containing protein n=1 Tax=Marivirga aurantiaca TaxID=2802615 RepID=A0A935CBN2_9BACT|nr:Type 1 glutamine amidotransferase-like domain-containing protein [Marivirga aurantiaca]MBK6266892.1 Type 1 glutamine amidotransferase-like domain-containing protein [Marivirga aurantiaca]
MFKKIIFFIGSFLFVPFSNFSQGNLMLVGGGSESNGGWSDLPYSWMVENASNKKIGIISYNEADEWLPNYFKSLGAAEADNIKISSRAEAATSAMFNQLSEYDALFFKGGDQSKYYEFYKNTSVQQAIETIYNRGGVIGGTSAGMAILSGVIFTAEAGSVYPIDALENINSQYFTLNNDFLSFYPHYIFDTHFVERGRTARLIGFLAHWFGQQGEMITGIGVDDKTSLCIDSEGLGTVYGTGAASIYFPEKFDIENNQITDSEIKSAQLTHGQTYDLNLGKISDRTLAKSSDPIMNGAYYQVFGSGVKSISDNESLLTEVLQSNLMDGNIIILADEDDNLAESYKDYFEENQNRKVFIITTSSENNGEDKAGLRNLIRQSGLILILDGIQINNFFSGGPTGELLLNHLKRNNVSSIFLGDIVQQVGKSYSTNIYSDPFNAYYNDLIFDEGLNLLSDINIISKSFEIDAKDFYENISSSLVDRILTEELSYGIYLTGNSYFSYIVTESSEAVLKTGGNLPSVIIHNGSTLYEQTSQTVNGNISRMQYAFDSLTFKISRNTDILLGAVEEKEQEDYELEEETVLSNLDTVLYDNILLNNPVKDIIRINLPLSEIEEINIFNTNGKLVFIKKDTIRDNHINLNHLSDGHYLIIIKKKNDNLYYVNKMIKN